MLSSNKEYVLYLHENKYNHKKYFGITCQTPIRKRWRNGYGYQNNKHFYNSIQKYGWNEGFTHTILESGLSLEEACELEKKYILQHKTYNYNYGYNTTMGGDIPPMLGKHHSKEANEKNRKAHLGKKNRLSENGRKKIQETTSQWWQNASEEQRQQRLQGLRNSIPYFTGKIGNGAKKVYCPELDKIFDSSVAAANFLNKKDGTLIRKVCRGELERGYDYHWFWYDDWKKEVNL